MFGVWINRQVVLDGAVTGTITGLMALGLVLVYRSTRVINFAVGNMGIVGGALLPLLVVQYGCPFWIAVAVSLLAGGLFGLIVELTVVRRLFKAPRVILLVATVGVAQLAQAVIASFPKIDGTKRPKYPQAVGSAWHPFDGLRVTGAQVSILVVAPLCAAALGWTMNRTLFGKTVAASVDNTELARLSRVNPRRVSTSVWVIAALLSTLSIVLLSAQTGSVRGLETLGAVTLSRALVAAVLARMISFPRALAAGILLGIVESVARFNALGTALPTVFRDTGFIDFALMAVVLVVVYAQGRQRAEVDAFSFVPKPLPVPERLRSIWWLRASTPLAMGALLAAAVALPIIVDRPSRHLLYTTILCFAICGLSVTVVTGWSGQLSLSQMTFAGLGALIAAALHRGAQIDVFGITGQAPKVPFGVAILIAPLLTAAIAAVIGRGALKVPGLLLAVSTFVFALAAQNYLFKRPILSDHKSDSVAFVRTELLGLDLRNNRTYYFVCLTVLVIVVAMMARLRRSGIARSIIAVRDNPDTAAAYTIEGARIKASAFALAGGVAGIGGALLAGLIDNVPLIARFWQVGDSLVLVGLVVIGGIGSINGPLLGALWVIGLPAFFPGTPQVSLFTSSIGLLIVLMYIPGGFVQIAYSVRAALLAAAQRHLPPEPTVREAVAVPVSVGRTHSPSTAETVLSTADVHVRFGGVMAVAGVDLVVRPNEIVGLIGTNGSGKSTLMNAIGGFVPATGRFEMFGDDIANLGPAQRARMGLGRTFQNAALFPELTLRETVLTALEARHRTPFVATAAFLPSSTRIERVKRSEANELIDFLGLGRYADRYISELSTGTRRIVELAGLLALDAKLLCLDEPTAGVAQREVEAFGPLLRRIRDELGAAMLVIEHDMPMIMALCTRIYALEAGTVIAEGTPHEVRSNPRVIASYLGTDERAIVRSGSAAQLPNAQA